ncbi:S-layer homology domain-containing protein [Paenibacillus yanchengensis]|uniref:S-layer homology domain-containing protein n=1 Tax=Paenibacillus yanchengensis TaxID=2035833 RepID=A0ABW4YF39_9BACL
MKFVKFAIVFFILIMATVSVNVQYIIASDKSYSDIDQSYAKKAIIELTEKGIMNGITSQHFQPKSVITRGDFIVTLVKALQLPVDLSLTSSEAFNDVELTIAPYVTAAYKAGITNGFEDGKFRPSESLTREQAAKFLSYGWNIIKKENIDDSADSIRYFQDEDTISAWARPFVNLVVGAKLLQGHANGKFDPKGTLTREMTAQMVFNFIRLTEISPLDKPHAPSGLTASERVGSSITFSWDAPSDATNIVAYDIFNGWDGGKIGSSTTTHFTYNDMNPDISAAVYYVKSRDKEGRLSNKSNEYIFQTPFNSNLKIHPRFNTFQYNKNQQAELNVLGNISKEDAKHTTKIYATVHNLTSQDIIFSANNPLGQPEIIQEGSSTKPLIVAWGGPNGIRLSDYVLFETSLSLVIKFDVTLQKKGLYFVDFELRTLEETPQILTSQQAIMTGELQPIIATKPEFYIETRLDAPTYAKVNEKITIPVTITGKISPETILNRLVFQVRFIEPPVNLSQNDVSIENIPYFGETNESSFSGNNLIFKFEQSQYVSDLQAGLEKGITFDLVITIQKLGTFNLAASISPKEFYTQLPAETLTGNVSILTVE